MDLEPNPDRLGQFYRAAGSLLMTAAVLIALIFGVRLSRQAVFASVEANAGYWVLADLPQVPLPATTPQVAAVRAVALVPTPIPTPTPRAYPPLRLQIPAIDLDWPVVESKLVERRDAWSQPYAQWSVPANAVGYQYDSSLPGTGGNVVMAGHNNTQGRVFQHLPKLKPGDWVQVHTLVETFTYKIIEKTIVPYRVNPTEGERKLREYILATGSDRITLLSCYPFYTNADRIVVVAERVDEEATP